MSDKDVSDGDVLGARVSGDAGAGPARALSIRVGLQREDFELAVDATLPMAGITGLTGPSGAGKSTLLRLVAGLDRPDTGRIALGAETWADTPTGRHVPAYRRPVGLVFQTNQLFPHMSVAGNLRYAAERVRPGGRAPGLDEVVAALDLAGLLDRRPTTLSGGEQRRVALGRSLLNGPDLLLLDEPLTGLDQARKRHVLGQIEAVHRRFAMPMLYVSHDITDLVRLADTTWIMETGRIVRQGATRDVLAEPVNPLALPLGAVVDALVSGHDASAGLTRLALGHVTLDAPLDEQLTIGRPVRLWIGAQDVSIALARPSGLSIRNILPATIEGLGEAHRPHEVAVSLSAGGQRFRALVSAASARELNLADGQSVYALVKAIRLAD